MTKDSSRAEEAAEIVADKIVEPVKKIIRIFENNHGIFRGSHEDTVTIAQGAIMIDTWSLVRNRDDIKINHDMNALNDKNAIEGRYKDLMKAIDVANGIDQYAALNVNKTFGNLILLTKETEDNLQMTLGYAAAIKSSLYKRRMDGVYFVAGGRDVSNLPSEQYKDPRYKELRKKNNSDASIYVNLSGSTFSSREVERRIASTPLNEPEVMVRLNPIKNAIDRSINSASFPPGSPSDLIFRNLKKKL